MIYINTQPSYRAQHLACVNSMRGYQHATATIEQQQAYASCVEITHPTTSAFTDPTVLILCKVLIIGALIGTLIGALHGFMNPTLSRPVSMFTDGLLGLTFLPLIILVGYGAWYGLKFVFTA